MYSVCDWAKTLPWKIWSLLLQALSTQLLTLGALMVPRVRPGTSAQLWVSIPGAVFACLCVSPGSIYLRSSRMALLCPNAFADSDTELWYSLPPPRLTAGIERIARVISSREQESRARDWTFTCIHDHAHFYGPNSTVKHFMGLSIKDAI